MLCKTCVIFLESETLIWWNSRRRCIFTLFSYSQMIFRNKLKRKPVGSYPVISAVDLHFFSMTERHHASCFRVLETYIMFSWIHTAHMLKIKPAKDLETCLILLLTEILIMVDKINAVEWRWQMVSIAICCCLTSVNIWVYVGVKCDLLCGFIKINRGQPFLFVAAAVTVSVTSSASCRILNTYRVQQSFKCAHTIKYIWLANTNLYFIQWFFPK